MAVCEGLPPMKPAACDRCGMYFDPEGGEWQKYSRHGRKLCIYCTGDEPGEPLPHLVFPEVIE